VTSVVVFASALATALATGLGAVPFAFARERVGGWLGPANAIASGVMLGASAGLLIEGGGRSVVRTLAGGAPAAAGGEDGRREDNERENSPHFGRFPPLRSRLAARRGNCTGGRG